MLKFKHEMYVLVVVLLLSAALLCTAVGCKATEPAVSEAAVAEPTASAVPTEGNQQLSLSLTLPEDAQTGDLLVALNGVATDSVATWRRAISSLRGAGEAQLAIQRGPAQYRLTLPID